MPENSIPNEIWRILLGTSSTSLSTGIGHEHTNIPIHFQQLLFQVFCLVRKTQASPLQWHCSKSFSIAKKNQAEVLHAFDAQRTVHTLDPVCKAYYKHLLDCMHLPPPIENEYGYLKGRRREAAIKQQLLTQHRLKSNKISQDTLSHDMRNAFASITFDVMHTVLGFLVDRGDWPLVQQRFKNASTQVPGHPIGRHFSIGSGALPGDKIAADLFFQRAIAGWLEDTHDDCLKVFCPILKKQVNIGKSAYADDVCSKQVYLTPPTPKTIENKHNLINQHLDKWIHPLGLMQNTSKQETRVSLCGTGAHKTYRQLKQTQVLSHMCDAMKYFGGVAHLQRFELSRAQQQACCRLETLEYLQAHLVQ